MADTAGTVIFSGENPGLTIYRPGTTEVIAAMSYWRCVYSAAGDGNALLLWVADGATDNADFTGTHIYSDNAGMARIVADRFTQYFEDFQNRGFDTAEPKPARFHQDGDGRWYHRMVAYAGDNVIELTWANVLKRALFQPAEFKLGPTSWDVASYMCPCEHGSILINNQAIDGEVRVTRTENDLRSSAFMAFSETWVERA
jgi:hypothetical protein